MNLKTLDVAMTVVGAALYTVVGVLTNLGIVSPVVGVVRFWPAVIVPAIFAVLFGPWVGGVGAAIGIFFSDMIYPGHGIALLSVTVGVPANFACFFLIGYLSRRNIKWRDVGIGGLVASAIIVGTIGYLFNGALLSSDVALLFAGVFIGSYVLLIIVRLLLPEWKSYGVASVIGLLIGSAYIGLTLWIYSYFFPLPLAGLERNAPFYATLLWFVWTFSTEIPFLIVVVPPVLKVCYSAFPSLKPTES